MIGIAIAALLAASPGNPAPAEPETTGFFPGFAARPVAPNVDSFTARLNVTPAEDAPPESPGARAGAIKPSTSVAPEATPVDEWNWHPKTSASSDPESSGTGWISGGTVVGALAVGVSVGLTVGSFTGNIPLGFGLGLAGGIVGGVGGYYLGLLAARGVTAARVGIVLLIVIEAVAAVGGVLALASTYRPISLGLGPL